MAIKWYQWKEPSQKEYFLVETNKKEWYLIHNTDRMRDYVFKQGDLEKWDNSPLIANAVEIVSILAFMKHVKEKTLTEPVLDLIRQSLLEECGYA